METMEAIQGRRTIRRFLDKRIPDNVLAEILEAGFKAPSNDHLRKWEVVIINDITKKHSLVESLNHNRTTDDAIKAVNGSGMVNEAQKEMYIDAIPLQYRMLIASGALLLPFFYQPKDILRPTELSDLNYFASIWCFIENVLIAAADHHIYGVTRIPTEDERKHVKEFVHAPHDYEFPCYVSLGYKEESGETFKQVETVVRDHTHFDAW